MIEYKQKRTLGDKMGAGMYVFISKLWVGKVYIDGDKELLSDREFEDMFTTIDGRDYVKPEVYNNVDSQKQVLLLNLLRAKWRIKLTVPAIIQCMLVIVAMQVVVGWFLLGMLNLVGRG